MRARVERRMDWTDPGTKVATTDADAVSAKMKDSATATAMSTNLAEEGISGATVTVAAPEVVENTYVPTSSDGASIRVGAAVVGIIVAALTQMILV